MRQWLEVITMKTKNQSTTRKPSISRVEEQINNALSLLGGPPLLTSDDPDKYSDLLLQIAEDVQPQNFIDAMMVYDITYLTWDVVRMRRLKAEHIDVKQQAPAFLGSEISLPFLEGLEKMIASAEMRRQALFWELEQRHQRVAENLRHRTDEIIANSDGKVGRLPAPRVRKA